MLPSLPLLRQRLLAIIQNKHQQGYQTEGLREALDQTNDSYDALDEFANKLHSLNMRPEWTYQEPDSYEQILESADIPNLETLHAWAKCVPDDITERIQTGFKASLCGCILGKPIEINPTLNALKLAGEACNEWPINDYISESFLQALGGRHDSWVGTTLGNISHVVPDDDINYSILGMLLIEKHGLAFTANHVREQWLKYLPIGMTFGPERTLLAKAAMASLNESTPSDAELLDWSDRWNPGDEYCGAFIRMDAYGYACAGRPLDAVKMAFTDAHFTHRKTGLYASMYIAAAIALAPVISDALSLFREAARFIPQKSRLCKIILDSLEQIQQSSSWENAYDRIHQRYGEYCHCQLYQEIGTLIISLHYAKDVTDALCKQVSQGNDTDSFGATCGTLAGLFFGKKAFDESWMTPFQDEILTSLAGFEQRSITLLSERMSQLPELVQAERDGKRVIEEPPQVQFDYGKGLAMPITT